MQAFTALQVVSAVAGGMSGRAEAMSESARAQSEARMAETQALQRDTIAREDLDTYLSSLRASRAANGLSHRSPNAFILERDSREAATHNRLVQRADDRQRAQNLRTAAKSYRKRGTMSLITGVGRAAVPLAEYVQYKKGA